MLMEPGCVPGNICRGPIGSPAGCEVIFLGCWSFVAPDAIGGFGDDGRFGRRSLRMTLAAHIGGFGDARVDPLFFRIDHF